MKHIPRYANHLRGLLKDLDHLGTRQLIKNIAPFALRSHQLSFAQDHQVLGNTCLAHAQNRFQVADAGFLLVKQQQDPNARGLPNEGKQL